MGTGLSNPLRRIRLAGLELLLVIELTFDRACKSHTSGIAVT
jgi:hypothetical protein